MAENQSSITSATAGGKQGVTGTKVSTASSTAGQAGNASQALPSGGTSTASGASSQPASGTASNLSPLSQQLLSPQSTSGSPLNGDLSLIYLEELLQALLPELNSIPGSSPAGGSAAPPQTQSGPQPQASPINPEQAQPAAQPQGAFPGVNQNPGHGPFVGIQSLFQAGPPGHDHNPLITVNRFGTNPPTSGP